MYSKHLVIEKLQLAVLDAVVVFSALLGAVWLRHGWGLLSLEGPSSPPWTEYLFPGMLLAAVFLVLLRLHGLYSRQLGRLTEALGLVKVTSLATMAVVTLTFFYRGYSYSRATVLIFYPLCIAALLGARGLFRLYSRAVLSNRAAARRVLIVGFGQVGRHLGQVLLDDPSYYELVGFLDDDPYQWQKALHPSQY